MRLIFAGTPEFAVPALDALVAAGHQVVAVYTQPDRPAGRGRKCVSSPVKARAESLGIPVEQPVSLKSPADQAALRAYVPDAMIVVAYGLLLPQAILDIPKFGCLNIHASLLPRWRGAAPIPRAIAAGDTETGVCIMQMEKGLDTGPVLLARRISIGLNDTGGTLHDRLAALGAEAVVEALALVESGEVTPEAQDSRSTTYAAKLTKQEGALDWSQPAETLARRIRAFNPWPVAYTGYRGKTLRVWAAERLAVDTGERLPGEIAAISVLGIDVVTGDGQLRITCLQPPGKRPMNAMEFLNGHPLVPGERLD